MRLRLVALANALIVLGLVMLATCCVYTFVRATTVHQATAQAYLGGPAQGDAASSAP